MFCEGSLVLKCTHRDRKYIGLAIIQYQNSKEYVTKINLFQTKNRTNSSFCSYRKLNMTYQITGRLSNLRCRMLLLNMYKNVLLLRMFLYLNQHRRLIEHLACESVSIHAY